MKEDIKILSLQSNSTLTNPQTKFKAITLKNVEALAF